MKRRDVTIVIVVLVAAAAAFLLDRRSQADRFEAIDRRIKSTNGAAPMPEREGRLHLRLRLARRDAGTDVPYTEIGLEGSDQWFELRRDGRTETLRMLRSVLARSLEGCASKAISAEIFATSRTPVPERDVVAALNVFVELGITDVVFEGGTR